MKPLPTRIEIHDDLAAATDAIADARRLRIALRRRTTVNDPERQKKIKAQLASLEGNGSILRSHLRRSETHDRPYTRGDRRVIHNRLSRLRYERRQLNKMLP